eukprot:scaffold633_cov321-Pavlova_lutheri.AAC.19
MDECHQPLQDVIRTTRVGKGTDFPFERETVSGSDPDVGPVEAVGWTPKPSRTRWKWRVHQRQQGVVVVEVLGTGFDATGHHDDLEVDCWRERANWNSKERSSSDRNGEEQLNMSRLRRTLEGLSFSPHLQRGHVSPVGTTGASEQDTGPFPSSAPKPPPSWTCHGAPIP